MMLPISISPVEYSCERIVPLSVFAASKQFKVLNDGIIVILVDVMHVVLSWNRSAMELPNGLMERLCIRLFILSVPPHRFEVFPARSSRVTHTIEDDDFRIREAGRTLFGTHTAPLFVILVL